MPERHDRRRSIPRPLSGGGPPGGGGARAPPPPAGGGGGAPQPFHSPYSLGDWTLET
ncbi:MAG: hypothetical protein IPJ48_03830 [Propionivibrio sp.]|uniref:Uncharacterized protein n=1 Tax=Candidatus Propionivibrio dominans TaxID=2954373 RepID=A0A9D7FC52_9RHOO|nr:hypothetical protein [Candidatus Propionivibrio dominans]